ncbi:uncharacterized protein PAN0_005d2516 [Moesziomyces antarcticus]|uniref:Uncharacterized protein n=2 Tax=Pseudozyma antarctica TaxID=84753 RepID=A0A081CCA8_PSEA2|nr:uncharacterized protein PAN0_005d2516 [Moesziomyces antarcticus]GAK64304.1 conserved hypothetical protein [Moesziomyces antarcticus]SPO45194.1 uncharacterized protein PSANT_02880 [Moesziomyces antarcticus]
MTLTSSTSIPSASLTGSTPQYLIFFSSGNPPWCPDCVDAQPAINHVFGSSTADAHTVLVDRPDWKSPDNIFRTQFSITCIPTITKMINGKEVARIEDAECKTIDSVTKFIQ